MDPSELSWTQCDKMNIPSDIQSISSDLSDRTVSFNLTLHGAQDISLRSCEVLGRGYRNRVSFCETKAIEDILVSRLANAIKSCLHGLPDGPQVISLPDFLVEVPGLALSGVHLMIMDTKNDLRSAIIRFTEFLGAVNRAFSADIGFEEPHASYSEKLAINVLADICLPILNLCASFDELNHGHDQKHAQRISDRAREFQFQTELLKRFIYNTGLVQDTSNAGYLYYASDGRSKRIAGLR